NDSEGANPLNHARRGNRFAVTQYASRGENRVWQVLDGASGAGGAFLDRFKLLAKAVGIGQHGEPSIADFAGKFQRLGSVGGDMNRNRVLQVDVAMVLMK